jgi:hypothetical protein
VKSSLIHTYYNLLFIYRGDSWLSYDNERSLQLKVKTFLLQLPNSLKGSREGQFPGWFIKLSLIVLFYFWSDFGVEMFLSVPALNNLKRRISFLNFLSELLQQH